MTDPIELAELLDVDGEDLAGGGAFIAADRLGRLQRRQRLGPGRLRMRLTTPPKRRPQPRLACRLERQYNRNLLTTSLVVIYVTETVLDGEADYGSRDLILKLISDIGDCARAEADHPPIDYSPSNLGLGRFP